VIVTAISKSLSASAAVALCLALLSGCSSTGTQAVGATASLPAPSDSLPRIPATAPQPASSPSSPSSPRRAADRTELIARDGEVELQRSNEVVSVSCRAGGEVDLQADNVSLRAVGRCEAISVDGQNNVVIAEYADELSVDGIDNSVRAARAGELDVDGSHNSVEARAILRTLDVEGTQNTVRFGGSPRTDIEDGNAVSPLTR
jgi:hypothetical protein